MPPSGEGSIGTWSVVAGDPGIDATIVDRTTGQPPRSGQLAAYVVDAGVGVSRASRTDSLGYARLDSLPHRRYVVYARSLGYHVATDTLEVTAGKRWVGVVKLAQSRCRVIEVTW